MPNIVEYVNREGITPTDRGTEARVQQGRRIGASFNQVSESLRNFGNRTAQDLGGAIRDAGDAAVAYAEHREIAQGVQSYALLQDSLTNQWNDIAKNADPNDPTVRERFINNTLSPMLDKWSSAFHTDVGQNWARGRTSALLDHMGEKTAADMGTLAAQQVTNSVRTVGNTYQNTAYNDPSSVDHLLRETDGSIGALIDSSPNLKGVAAGKARTDITERQKEAIVKAGAQGAIAKSSNPEATAAEWTRRYPQYITGEEAKAFAGQARQEIRARNYDFETNRRRAREIAQDTSTEASNQYLIDVRSQDPKLAGDPTASKILNDPRLTKTDKNNLLNYIDRQHKPETDARVSAQTFNGIMRDLNEPDSDPVRLNQRAWDAYTKGEPGQAGSLNYTDFTRLRKEIEDRKTPEGMALQQDRDRFFKRFESTIDPAVELGVHTAAGEQAIYFAQDAAQRQEQDLRRRGINPHELYNPSSQYYFGKPENIDQYRQAASLTQNMKMQLPKAKKGEPPPLPPLVQRPPSYRPDWPALPLPPDKPNASFSERFGASFGTGGPAERAGGATGVLPSLVRQGGHIYKRQPDGSMKDMGPSE